MSKTNPHLTRRTALRTVAAGTLASIAGCLNGNTNSPAASDGTQSDDQNRFQRVAIDDTSLIVELASDTDIDQLNVIQPNGELFAQRQVAAGARQVTFDLGVTYQSGEYSIVGLSSDETVVETTRSIKPDLQVLEMGIGRNQPEEMWDGEESEISDQAFVTVENRGSGPDSITKLVFLGEVPLPSNEDGTGYADDEDVSGIYDPDIGSETEELQIESGEQLTIYSSRSPFAFVSGAGQSCTDEPQSGEFSMILETRVDGDRVSKTYKIQYSAANEEGECEISISEE